MTLTKEAQTSFVQDGTKAALIAVPEGQRITIHSNGGTLYYDNASTVSSSSNDGNLTTGTSASFTTPQYVICAATTSTNVFVQTTEGVSGDIRVGDDLTVVDDFTVGDALTATGGFVPTSAPASIHNALPATATAGTDTFFADGTLFLSSIFVPVNMTLTGIGFLVGSVGGTDKVVARLYTSAGAIAASSTTASSGTTAGTAAQLQEIAFTSTYAAVGPQLFFIGIAANGGTAKLRTLAAYTGAKTFSGSVSLTHAATTAITVPTAFAADKAPTAYVY